MGASSESIRKQSIRLLWREKKTFKKAEDGFIFIRYHHTETDDESEHPTAMELAITAEIKAIFKRRTRALFRNLPRCV